MCVVAVLGSLMVSYTRARAEALGVECKVGLATRPVRVVLLSIGLIFAKGAGIGDFELLAPAIYVDRRPDHLHRLPARMACAKRALPQMPPAPRATARRRRSCNQQGRRVCFATQRDPGGLRIS